LDPLVVQRSSSAAGPSCLVNRSSFLQSRSPLKSLATSWPPDPPAGLDSPKVPGPLQRNPPRKPHRRRAVTLASVPLSGFLNLSAVSWQPRTPWPCFVPQPFLGSPPSEFSPRRERALLSKPPAPLQLSTNMRESTPRDFHPPVSPTPTPSRSCLVPPDDYELPFRKLNARFPVTLISNDEALPFRWLHLLRSLVPPANPFAPARVTPDQRPLLSWVSAPPELSPPAPRILYPLQPESRSTPLPEGWNATRRTSRPFKPGETFPVPKYRNASSVVPDSLRNRTTPPLGDAPSPSTLVAPSELGTS
jgi:hypothetical protein